MSYFKPFRGYDGFEIHIDTRRIVAVKPHIDSNKVAPKCMIYVACEKETEEWTLREEAEAVLATLAAALEKEKA